MYQDRGLWLVRNIATNMGIEGTITNSRQKGKRFMITRPDGVKIHFGSWPFTGEGTYNLEHGDKKIRRAWKARHRKILKDGKPAYKNPDSPEYYSWRLLWS
jgi:hypothetical protein